MTKVYDVELFHTPSGQACHSTIEAYTLGDAVAYARNRWPSPEWQIVDVDSHAAPFDPDSEIDPEFDERFA